MLTLAPLKRLALSARVVTSESRPQPPCTEPLPTRAGEELVVVAAAEESSVPPHQSLPPPLRRDRGPRR
jgi:hypothetical protein